MRKLLLSCGIVFLFLFLLIPVHSNGQIDTASIIINLNTIRERDQKTRKSSDSADFRQMIDSSNLVQIEGLISKFGWPGISFVGARGNNTVFLVIQHADLKTQEKYLPLLEKSVSEKESRPADLALLKDRILMRQGKKQIYGSQISINKETGQQEFWPIEDEINVNKRRAEAGLDPIEEYAKFFGIEYKPK